MKHRAKRVFTGIYHYRGHEIDRSNGPWQWFKMHESGIGYVGPIHDAKSLREAKREIDKRVEGKHGDS